MLKLVKSINTPRVKSLCKHASKPLLLVGFFDGSIQLINTSTQDTKTLKLSEKTIRSAIFHEPLDYIITGDDTGYITVLRSDFSVVAKFNAHSDFIRKVRCGDALYSCSDDATIKKWCLTSFTNLVVFRGHTHFVMDFFVSDHVYSVSLDCTVRVWDLRGNLVRHLNAHEQGINCISRYGQGFVTGSDDFSIRFWSPQLANSTTVHTGNVVALRTTPKQIISCSEDGTVKFLDGNLRVSSEIRHSSRVWDVIVDDQSVYVGTDDSLLFFSRDVPFLGISTIDRVYYYSSGLLSYARIHKSTDGNVDDNTTSLSDGGIIGALKEISLDDPPQSMSISPSGRVICINSGSIYKIYSILGFRQRASGHGSSYMIDDTNYIRVTPGIIEMVDKSSTLNIFEYSGDINLFILNGIVYAYHNNQIYHNKNNKLEPLFSVDGYINHFYFVDGCYIYSTDNKTVVLKYIDTDNTIDVIYTIDSPITAGNIMDGILFYVSNGRVYYLLIGNKVLPVLACDLDGSYIGVVDYRVYSYTGGLVSKLLDRTFIKYQIGTIKGEKLQCRDPVRAAAFLVSIGEYASALEYCDDSEMRFEILILLGRLEEAGNLAESRNKIIRMGQEYIKKENYKQAALWYKMAGEYSDAYLLDSDINLGDELTGNIGLFKYLHEEKFDKVGQLLKETIFYNIFKKNYGE